MSSLGAIGKLFIQQMSSGNMICVSHRATAQQLRLDEAAIMWGKGEGFETLEEDSVKTSTNN